MWGLVRPEPKKPKVCFGSIASVWLRTADFRSAPVNGQNVPPLACIQHNVEHHQFRLRLHLRSWLQ